LPARWATAEGRSLDVPFTFEAESASAGVLFTTLGPGGESFRGSYVLLQDATAGHVVTAIYDGWSAPEWELWEKQPDGQWMAEATRFGDFANFYTGQVLAYLSGSRGDAMRCRFRLGNPDAGFLGGGAGECQASDGGRVDLDF